LVSFVDLLGIGLFFPLIEIITNTDKDSFLKYQFFYDISNQINLPFFYFIVILISFTFILKFLMALILNFIIFSFCQNVQKYLRIRLFDHYQNLNYQDYVRKNTGDIIYTVTTLTSQFISGVLTTFLQIMSELVIVFVILLFLFYKIGYPLLFISITFLSLIYIYDLIFKKLNREYGIISNESGSEINKIISESFYGLKEIKFLNKNFYFKNKLINSCSLFANNNLKQQFIVNSPRYFIEVVTLSILMSYLVLNQLYFMDPNIVVNLGVIGFSSLRILPSLNRIAGGISKFRYNLNTINKIYDELSSVNSKSPLPSKNKKFISLDLRNITFGYTDKKLLFSVDNFNLERGDFICITGESGSGKSTFIDLLLGLNIPNQGEIFFNDSIIDNNNLSSLWHGKISYITQSPLLMDTSILENITLSDSSFNAAQLNYSINKSNLNIFIDSLPNGYNTKIGDRGVMISGGQRQRIALARALYHDREVLILDESTNALDSSTEDKILSVIRSLEGLKTVIMISHNSSVLNMFKSVYKFSNNRLILT
jgi:ABC-type bacteriocin/lantibiotic exporter with double-glycine peptidase domain